MSETTNNMNVGSQVEVGPIKPVHRKTIEGSTPGDFRDNDSSDFSTDFAKNSPGPREAKGQARTSKFNVDSPADPIKGGSGSAESE